MNQANQEEMHTSKKLILKMSKKHGMRDSQVILHHLAESLARESQRLEPCRKPINRIRSSSVREEADVQLFQIPQQVGKFMGSYVDYEKILEDHCHNQKLRIQMDFQHLKEEILIQLAQKQQQLLDQVDGIFEGFRENCKILIQSCNELKESFHKIPSMGSMFITLHSLNVFNGVTKIKEYKLNYKLKLSNLESELMKRSIIFMVEELEKQIFHKPTFNQTETEQLLFQEMKTKIQQQLNEELDKVTLLNTQQNQFDSLLFLPQIETVINFNRQNCMGGDKDMQELENLKQLIASKLKSTKFNMNISLGLGNAMKSLTLQMESKFKTQQQLLTIIAIDDNIVAVGAKNGLVQMWDIRQRKMLNAFQARQPVTVMRLFKGYAGDFNVSQKADLFSSRIDTKEENFLITGNQEIKIWEIRTGSLIKSIKLQGIATSICALQDYHTLITGTDEGRLYFNNAYSGMIMKKLSENQGTICSIVTTKEGRLAVASKDRSITIYQIHYVKSSIYGRMVFGDCSKQIILQDVAQVYTLQTSMIDESILVSAGSDSIIKIWNLNTLKVEKEIQGHKCPVADMVMLENPIDADKMFALISLSTGDDVLRISTSISPLNSGVYMDEKLQHPFGATSSPLMQLCLGQDRSLRLIVVDQSDQQQFIVLKLQ